MKTLLALFCIFLFSNAHAATYQLGVDAVKPISCIDPTQRTDNTALAPADIKEVNIQVTGPGSYSHKVTMIGGCKPTDLPIAGLAPGTYTMIGETIDNGGRVSPPSPPVNFTLLAPIAPPKAPVVLP